MLLVAGMATGCEEFPQQFAYSPRQQPAQPARQTPTPKLQPPADDAMVEPSDGSTVRAVREFLADLESVTANTQEPALEEGPDPIAEAQPAPAPDETPIARANKPVDLRAADGEHTEDESAKMPARPVVLAAALVGDPGAAALETLPAETATLGVHRGLDTASPSQVVSLRRLIEHAEELLSEDPASATTQWQLSLLQLAADQPTEAAQLSPAIAQESRALISRFVTAAASAYRLLSEPLAGADEALAAVEELRTLLRAEAELLIPVVALCVKVTTFGVYDELPAEALQPYQANRVIVYCEIKNFTAQEQDPGRFHSSLSARLELFTSEGRSLWVREEHEIEDLSRQRREDFFLAQLVTLPADLAPGDYVLKVTVTDLLAEKTNEAAHRFSIPGVPAISSAVP